MFDVRDRQPTPPTPVSTPPAPARALFAEARRRRWRRHVAGAVAGLLLAGSAAAGLLIPRPGEGAGTGHERPAAGPAAHGPGSALPAVRVAWVDDTGQLHIGDLANGQQRVTASVDASPSDPMIAAGGQLYWASVSQSSAPVMAYDIATGKIRPLARGNSVFTSADGQHVYIAQSGTRLTELAADGTGTPRRLALPAGWTMSGLLGNWSVAGGIVIYSSDADPARRPATVAVWNPGTGRVTIIGRGLDILDAYTAPGGRYSLLAWTPAGCGQHCPVRITNTATRVSLTVPSPGRYGFSYGGLFTSGAFSPDGSRLAVLMNTTDPQDSGTEPVSELAIITTRTGALQLVPAIRLGTFEDAGWARWLPGGHQLLVGAEQGSYAVTAGTWSARPLPFGPGEDVNFSVTVLPVR